jgi:hypothetical protein
MMEGVNLTKIYNEHFCKCHYVSPVQYYAHKNKINKNILYIVNKNPNLDILPTVAKSFLLKSKMIF